MIRSIAAILSGPVVFGALCVPANFLIVSLFPSYFDEQWVTSHNGMLALLVSLTLIYAAASGFVSAMIASHHVGWHVVAMGVLQLAIGISVQSRFWTVLPVWYHLTFFALLVLGIPLGAVARVAMADRHRWRRPTYVDR